MHIHEDKYSIAVYFISRLSNLKDDNFSIKINKQLLKTKNENDVIAETIEKNEATGHTEKK